MFIQHIKDKPPVVGSREDKLERRGFLADVDPLLTAFALWHSGGLAGTNRSRVAIAVGPV